MNKPHKHAELIKAWADGAEIEFKVVNGPWIAVNSDSPLWYKDNEYRIKPAPKPDFFRYVFADSYMAGYVHKTKWPEDTLKLTFDGETGELKAAEVLK
jgi:hypothetical protein